MNRYEEINESLEDEFIPYCFNFYDNNNKNIDSLQFDKLINLDKKNVKKILQDCKYYSLIYSYTHSDGSDRFEQIIHVITKENVKIINDQVTEFNNKKIFGKTLLCDNNEQLYKSVISLMNILKENYNVNKFKEINETISKL